MNYNEYLKNERPYQEYGCNFLLERKHACLFYKPGKGKTYPVIKAVREIEAAKKRDIKVLVLSTAAAIKMMWLVDIDPQKIMPK